MVITCNEAEVIEQCLKSLAGWVDEIVVVDMQSEDGTREIVDQYAHRVISTPRIDYADPARNLALSQAAGDWVIMLDPDEWVPESLAEKLQSIASADSVDVVIIPMRVFVLGGEIEFSGFRDDAHPRFFRAGVLDWPAAVHTNPSLSGLRVRRLPRERSLMLHHHTWATVPAVLDRMRRYTPNEVALLLAAGERFSVGKMLDAGRAGFYRYFVAGKGYKDGTRGLMVALLMAMYHLVIHMQLWQATEARHPGSTREMDRSIKYLGGGVERAYAMTLWPARLWRAVATRLARR